MAKAKEEDDWGKKATLGKEGWYRTASPKVIDTRQDKAGNGKNIRSGKFDSQRHQTPRILEAHSSSL